MNIVLSPELENLVNEQVKSGLYDSPSEVVRDGLLLLKEKAQLKQLRREELRREVQKGIDDIREGRFTVYDADELDKLADEIICRGMKNLERKQNGK
ncbi:MAG: type II toxin-antitoxin system ParD family antitoxin [Acidobacteriota bacterium]|nr:type II toxin-antitoxin system ParD family antitoxin [Acidobacteriota bacterium]